MDSNFRFKRHRKPSHRRQALDGIVTPNSLPRSGSISFRRTPSSRHSGATTIGDFKRPDGYYPAQQSRIDSTVHGNVVEPPIVTEEPIKPKKKRFGRRHARRHKEGERRSWKKIALRSALALTIITVLIGGFLFIKGYIKLYNIFKGGGAAAALDENVDPARLRGEGDGRINILILGKGGPGHEAPDLTDTILVASIDPIQKEAALLSVPRDFYVKVPSRGSMKINAAYVNAKNSVLNGRKTDDQVERAEKAGMEAAQKVVETVLGIPMHYYVMVDFEAFRKAIDTVGGVTIDVKEALYDPSIAWENNNNPLIAAKGAQTFNGKKALLYARSRQSSPRGDFDRTQRQREIILALKEKVLSIGTFSNPVKVSQLIDAFGNDARTNLSLSEVMRLYEIGKEIPGNKVASVGLADPPNNFVVTTSINGQSVVVPRAGTYDYSEIQNFVRNELKDGFIRNENASIVILNGTTTAGLATKKAAELKSYGYNVTQVGDAPTKSYAKTILVDLRDGAKKYTKRYLEQRLKTTATKNLPDGAINPGTADFVIILGANETNNSQN